MRHDALRYEVWTEKTDGRWVQAPIGDELSTTKFKDANRVMESFSNDGTVLRAILTEVKPLKELNCAGRTDAVRMGLRGKNVKIEGALRLGPGINPFRNKDKDV